MSSTPTPSPGDRGRSRIIVGAQSNRAAKSRATHNQHGEIDLNSPLLAKGPARGPRRSAFKWGGITIFIKLFRLSVKFVPIAGAMVGAVYGYTYFFGAIPVVDAVKRELGMEVALREQTESRVTQMLQQTRDAVAASDSRVNLGNAIAAGDVAAADAIESGSVFEALTESPVASTAPAVSVPTVKLDLPKMDAETSKATETIDGIMTVFSGDDASTNRASTIPAQPSPTIARKITIVEDRSRADPAASAPPTRRITVVQNSRQAIPSRYHNIDTRSGRPASAEFSQWLQTIRVNRVIPDYKPKVVINNTEFVSGSIVDFAMGITFAGLAQDGTLLVFKDGRGAYLTAKF